LKVKHKNIGWAAKDAKIRHPQSAQPEPGLLVSQGFRKIAMDEWMVLVLPTNFKVNMEKMRRNTD